MGEYTFAIFRKLLCATLIVSLLWPDIAKCMNEEEGNSPQQPSFIPIPLKEKSSDQKGNLLLTEEQQPSIFSKENKPPPEEHRQDANNPSLSEKNSISEDNDENATTSQLPTETNIVSTESEFSEENPSENKISAGNDKDPSPESNDKEGIDEGENVSSENLSEIILIQEDEGEINNNLKNPSLEEEEDSDLYSNSPTQIIEENEENEDNPQKALIIEDEDKFSEKTKAFLSYFKKRIIDGWPTWKQVLGALVGTAIGGGVAIGTTFIILSDLQEVNVIGIEILFYISSFFQNISPSAACRLLSPVLITTAFDAIMRGSSTLMSLLDNAGQDVFLMSTKSYKKRLIGMKFLAHTGSCIASGLSVFYLLMANNLLDYFLWYETGFLSPFQAFLFLFPYQVLDASFSYGKSLSDKADKIIKKNIAQNHFKSLQPGSKAKTIEIRRQTALKQLKKLMWILCDLPIEEIKKLYDAIFQKKESSFQREATEEEKALETLLLLLQTHQKHEDKIDRVIEQKSKKKQASIFGWIVAGLASPARHFVFWYSVKNTFNTLSGIIHVNLLDTLFSAVSWPFAVILGGIIGATVQGYFEKENLAKSYYDITRGKSVTEFQCWKPIRVVSKIWNYLIQGPFYSFPYIITFFESIRTNPRNIQSPLILPISLCLIALIPFFTADAFNNATQFNKTSGQWISAINRLLSYTRFAKYLKGYQRDKLIEITHSYRNLMRDLDPSVVKELHEKLSKRIPNLFKTKINGGGSSQGNSETEEGNSFLKDTIFYDQDMIDNFNSPEGDIQFEMPKRSLLSSCWRGVTRCYQKVPSLNSCWKGVKAGFTFLFSSCRKRTKEREMDYFTEEDERESIIN